MTGGSQIWYLYRCLMLALLSDQHLSHKGCTPEYIIRAFFSDSLSTPTSTTRIYLPNVPTEAALARFPSNRR